jgi:hypothetical protein
MKTTKPVLIGSLFTGAVNAPAPWLARLREIQRLQDLVLPALPDTLREHCRVANLESGTLVLATESSVWSTRLRFFTPRLLSELRAAGLPGLRSIRIRVLPPQRSLSTATHRRTLSEPAAATLRGCAQGIRDPGLKAALLRLAQRAKRRAG